MHQFISGSIYTCCTQLGWLKNVIILVEYSAAFINTESTEYISLK